MSEFLKALEEAERETARREQGRRTSDAPGETAGEEPSDPSRRVIRWIEESLELFRALPLLVAEHKELRARAEQAERECERLRREVTAVGEDFRAAIREPLRLLDDRLLRFRPLTEPQAPAHDPSSRPSPPRPA